MWIVKKVEGVSERDFKEGCKSAFKTSKWKSMSKKATVGIYASPSVRRPNEKRVKPKEEKKNG